LSGSRYSSYNQRVKVARLHSWRVSTGQAIDIQRGLAARVSRDGAPGSLHFVAGVDISVSRALGTATAAVVVLSYPELIAVEVKKASGKLTLPYIPGLLSFRESPLILAACRMVSLTPDLVLVDGQGVAHPRRVGLASHLGLFLKIPTVGCAKSLLCGKYVVPGEEPGDYSEIVDRGETIGVALRTRAGVKPIYVSTGHLIGLEPAISRVLECCRGYRLPEPTRLAHLAAGGNLKPEKDYGEAGCRS